MTNLHDPKRDQLYQAPQADLHLLLAIWFGLLTGLGEVFLLAAKKFLRDQFIFVGIDVVWMVPLFNVVLFVILGFSLYLLSRVQPRLASLRVGVFVFSFLSFLTLSFMYHPLHIYAKIILSLGLAVQAARIAAAYPHHFFKLLHYTGSWLTAFKTRRPSGHIEKGGETQTLNDGLTRRGFLLSTGATVAGLALGTRGWQGIGERRKLAALPRTAKGTPNVVLLILDTVRAQNLGQHGYVRDTSPNLDRIAQLGVRFERAIATAPWTLPSHASMFTGRWPHELRADWLTPLDSTYPTLAEILSAHGYATAGFVANTEYASYETGLNRGFAHYEDYAILPGQIAVSSSLGRVIADDNKLGRYFGYHDYLGRKSAEYVNERFLRWISANEQRPFFAFLNYYDAHNPYLPPPPFDSRFGPKGDRVNAWHTFGWDWAPEQIQIELDAYDGAIAYLDHQIGLLHEELNRRGLLENTLLIIASDHGEQFGEHGLMNHGNSLYIQNLHVPMIMQFPGQVPSEVTITRPVTLRDLPVTILDILDLSQDNRIPGHSLAQHWQGFESQDDAASFTALAEVSGGIRTPESYPSSKGDMVSLFVDEYQYIRNGDGREELYNLEKDPSATRDLVVTGEHNDLSAQFKSALEAMLAQD